MNNYLSQIAGRFGGVSPNAPAQPQAARTALMPSSRVLGAPKAVDSSFPFFSPLRPDKQAEETSVPNQGQFADQEKQQLTPASLSNEGTLLDTKRKFFHQDLLFDQPVNTQYRAIQTVDPAVQEFPSGKIKLGDPQVAQAARVDEPVLERSPFDQSAHKRSASAEPKPPMLTVSPSDQVTGKSTAGLPLPVNSSKRQAPTAFEPVVTAEKTNTLTPQADQNSRLQKEIAGILPPMAQLRPAQKSVLPVGTAQQKQKNEGKLQIGNITIEILPTPRPNLNTAPFIPPKQALSPKPAPSVHQPRFPLRFGLGQI